MFSRLSIRWRLAGISAALTFAILCVFAYVIGEYTARRVRSDFTNQIIATTDDLAGRLEVRINPLTRRVQSVKPDLEDYAAVDRAAIRVLSQAGDTLARSGRESDLSAGEFPAQGVVDVNGYRVSTKPVAFRNFGFGYLQYGRRLSDVDATIRGVRFFLFFGVLTGTGLALMAGLMLAKRAMAPIAALTATTREIARTRDPNRRVPMPDGDDEVAELARTLEEMLQALEASRAEGALMLTRQRQFVADASHELRTPLTSVLANLDILAETLDGDHREVAESALRSSQRMRRLVADLLLLARQDARRAAAREPVDLHRVLLDVAAELGPIAEDHELHVDAEHATVCGARDELHRLVLNLVENAVKHTPPGTLIAVHSGVEGEDAVLSVRDEGEGVREELRERIFERFVRGAGDSGGSSGLGLAIVRAVAESHGGTVTLAPSAPGQGARF
ncbi:MAG: integral rane sensor signal transduction histidine kinase, partial [Solirubrobacterales bacterium]|nr:integral rane sensor signal transduction histidine kinase [Solirubrobacterales bacterium]